jgi:hypothetical protein
MKWMLHRVVETFSPKLTEGEAEAFMGTQEAQNLVRSFLNASSAPVLFVFFQPSPYEVGFEIVTIFLYRIVTIIFRKQAKTHQ